MFTYIIMLIIVLLCAYLRAGLFQRSKFPLNLICNITHVIKECGILAFESISSKFLFF